MPRFQLSQVNVFSLEPLAGNPVAVIHSAQQLKEAQMLAIARWTNLSETTFLLPPTDPAADYRVRIFSPAGELPFAGHPTLGSCHAWLCSGGTPKNPDSLVQQCVAGLVRIQKHAGLLEFAAPPLVRSGPLDEATLGKIIKALSLSPSDIVQHQWVDNGPGWSAVMLESAQKVLEVEPDWSALAPLNLGIVGPHAAGRKEAFEERAFVGNGGYEDPVTGSLNASLAQWLISSGLAKPSYVAAQGTSVQRQGRIHIRQLEDEIWVGGHVAEVIRGEISV